MSKGREMRLYGLSLGLVLLIQTLGFCYTAVTISTSAPLGLEKDFIASTTSQWLASLVVNPFFSGTYQIQLYGPNPNFNPPPTNMDYPYGWAAGVSYQQNNEIGVVSGYAINCSTQVPSYFSGTWDVSTCQAITGAIITDLYQEQLSTTPIPGF